MMGGPRVPGHHWYLLVMAGAGAVALLSGTLCYRATSNAQGFASLPDATRRELAALQLPRSATSGIEQNWAARLDRSDYFRAPVGPGPCSGAENAFGDSEAGRTAIAIQTSGDSPARREQLRQLYDRHDNLLVALIYGTDLIHANRHSSAAQLLRRQSIANVDETRRLIGIARDSAQGLDLNDAYVSTLIHLLHAHAVAELVQPGKGAPWDSLKNAIGIVKAVADRRAWGDSKGDPTWSQVPIPAPGCQVLAESLSSHDLYSNLIVAYMTENYVPPGSPEQQQRAREKEFDPEMHKSDGPVSLLYGQRLERTKADGWKDESKLWALSNIEQILGWGLPDDARLNVNIIRVLEETPCEGPWCGQLQSKKDELLEQALQRAADVSHDQQVEFARELTRLLAQSGIDRSAVEPYLQTIRGWMRNEDGEVLDQIRTAEKDRRDLPRWLTGLSDRPVPAGDWRAAAEVDFIDAAAAWAADQPSDVQEEIVLASHQLLGSREAPPALTALEKNHVAWWLRMKARKWFWAGVAALLALGIFWFLLWAIVAVRDYRLLSMNFYNVELDHLRASAPPPRNRGVR